MKIAEVCYAKIKDRDLRNDTANNELEELGFTRLYKSHAEYVVTDGRVEEFKSVIRDLNTMFSGSLWVCWWDTEKPDAPCERWYP